MVSNLKEGNMCDFITHTRNTIKVRCLHDCSYCYQFLYYNHNKEKVIRRAKSRVS